MTALLHVFTNPRFDTQLLSPAEEFCPSSRLSSILSVDHTLMLTSISQRHLGSLTKRDCECSGAVLSAQF